DTAAITDFSNRLDTAQSQLTLDEGRILVFSNHLAEAQSASLTLSNQWLDAQTAVARDAEQITSLNRQVAETAAANQTLTQHVMELTNQLTSQMTALAR